MTRCLARLVRPCPVVSHPGARLAALWRTALAALEGPLAAMLALLATALALGGCAAPKATVVAQELPFDQAAQVATDGLAQQATPTGLLRPRGPRVVIVDPMIEAPSGQQTRATQHLQRSVTEHLARRHAELFTLTAFEASEVPRAQLLLTGTLSHEPGGLQRLRLALTDIASGTVVAQASALARTDPIDAQPLPYDRDSPVLLRDAATAGYVRTTAAAPGTPGDAGYLARITTTAVVADATALYNSERYADALARYREAAAMPGGEQIRVLNGIYLTATRLGLPSEAEQAFGRVVALGIAQHELGVKFLFNAGTTNFWSDPRISGAYPMWLRQIGRAAKASTACLQVVGHTSRTGTEAANDALSLQRATVIRQFLVNEAPELAARLLTAGVGFRNNIVGSGTDNAIDALDRRVEFKVVPCS